MIYISTVSEFEFLAGVKDENVRPIQYFFEKINISSFDSKAAVIACSIYKDLRSKNQIIEFRDIFIGATAIANDLPLATLNLNHFNRIDNLEVITLK